MERDVDSGRGRKRWRSHGEHGAIYTMSVQSFKALQGDVLVAVAHIKIGVECPEIDIKLANAMRAIDTTQHTLFLAGSSQAFERNPYSRIAGDSIEESDFDSSTVALDLLYRLLELFYQPVVLDRVGVLDLDRFRRRRLGDVCHCLLASAIDRREKEDVVIRLVCQAAQDGVDARRSVGNEHKGLCWNLDECSECFT
jgi:hypothetical protein